MEKININLNEWIPKGSYNAYSIMWFDEWKEDQDKQTVGAVINSDINNFIIQIRVDDEWMNQNNQRGCCIHFQNESYKECFIILSKSFWKELSNNEEILFSLWHEIGHYHTMHYFPEYLVNASAMRRSCIEKGIVPPAEYAADLFGCLYAGKEAASSRLLRMIRDRYKMIDQGDNNALLAWHELRDRRKALKSLNAEDEIIQEIMKTCKVEFEQNI